MPTSGLRERIQNGRHAFPAAEQPFQQIVQPAGELAVAVRFFRVQVHRIGVTGKQIAEADDERCDIPAAVFEYPETTSPLL